MASVYPPAVDDAERDRLVQTVKDWSMANGLTVRPPPAAVAETEAALASTLAMPAPVTLFPSAFPRTCFSEAQTVQSAYNALYARISEDDAFLGRIVAEVAEGDAFTARLWALHTRVKQEGYVHTHALGIFRSDYLVHQDTAEMDDGTPHLQIKQVEFNTIAASFGGLSSQVARLHRFLAQTEYPHLRAAATTATTATTMTTTASSAATPGYDLPPNTSSRDIADALRAAFDVYEKSTPAALGLRRCILFVTQDGERNVFDQRHLEYEVVAGSVASSASLASSTPLVFRLPFSAVLQQTSVAATPLRQLLYRRQGQGQTYEVAVVYLRAGYGPDDYPDDAAWEGRFQLERSAAIKCPTVLTQVAGTKKVQQVLATPADANANVNELARFVPDVATAAALRRTFAHIYPLDTTSAAGRQARAWAQDPIVCRAFVLKPQREGGGNNYYKEAIAAHLQTVAPAHWSSYILMELITPPPVANTILRNGRVEQGAVICELGVYGTCIWAVGNKNVDADILRNQTAGYLLRTKGDQSEEGGVAAGFGSMDSVNLM